MSNMEKQKDALTRQRSQYSRSATLLQTIEAIANGQTAGLIALARSRYASNLKKRPDAAAARFMADTFEKETRSIELLSEMAAHAATLSQLSLLWAGHAHQQYVGMSDLEIPKDHKVRMSISRFGFEHFSSEGQNMINVGYHRMDMLSIPDEMKSVLQGRFERLADFCLIEDPKDMPAHEAVNMATGKLIDMAQKRLDYADTLLDLAEFRLAYEGSLRLSDLHDIADEVHANNQKLIPDLISEAQYMNTMARNNIFEQWYIQRQLKAHRKNLN